VDDNKLAVEIVKDLLTTWGYDTKTCGNSAEVFECVMDYQPDAILLDIMLPGMNGYAICSKLKSSAGTRTIPIIILTVLNNMEDRMQAYDMGADAFLSKPVKYQELKNRVEWAVRFKKSLDDMEPRGMVVRSLMNLLQAAKPETYRRALELSRYCQRVAKVMSVVDEELDRLIVGCCLCDIGELAADGPAGHIAAGLDIVAPLSMHSWLDAYIRYHDTRPDDPAFPSVPTETVSPANLRIMVTVERYLELAAQLDSESKALDRLREECRHGVWCEDVLHAIEQALRDADFQKKIVTM